jgi:hypothetical protein
MITKSGPLVCLFVEGDTDKEFYEALMKHYEKSSKKPITSWNIIPIKGIGKFQKKVPSKLKNEILPKNEGREIIVVCSYDTDVFEFAKNPPTNWAKLEKSVKELKIRKFFKVQANKMIEDWFLEDINGICKFLKIKPVSKVKGKDGNDKMKKLFKKGNKVYQKGNYSHKFIPSLNISMIRSKIKSDLLPLEQALNYKDSSVH